VCRDGWEGEECWGWMCEVLYWNRVLRWGGLDIIG
jgi:hypothetical protein